MSKIIHLNLNNFDSEIANGKVVVDFFANWCGPCKMLGPVLEEIAQENDDIKVCKVNVDEESALAQKFGVMSIPTVLIFDEGKLVDKSVGFKNKQALLAIIK